MSDFNNFNKSNFNFQQNKQQSNVDLDKYKPLFKKVMWTIGAIIVLMIVFNSFTFTVDETEQVVVRQFNEIIRVIVSEENYDEVKERLTNDTRFNGIVPVICRVKLTTNSRLPPPTSSQ